MSMLRIILGFCLSFKEIHRFKSKFLLYRFWPFQAVEIQGWWKDTFCSVPSWLITERAGIGMRDQQRVTKGIRIVKECRNKGKKTSFLVGLLHSVLQSLLQCFLATQGIWPYHSYFTNNVLMNNHCLRARSNT